VKKFVAFVLAGIVACTVFAAVFGPRSEENECAESEWNLFQQVLMSVQTQYHERSKPRSSSRDAIQACSIA